MTSLQFDKNMMWVYFGDGRVLGVPLSWFPRLSSASHEQLNQYSISSYGIHWEELDEDLSFSGLMAYPLPESIEQLRQRLTDFAKSTAPALNASPAIESPTGVLAGPLADDTPALPWEVTEAVPQSGFRFMVRFVDGLTGTVDLGQLIHSPCAGVFATLADPDLFAQLYIQDGVVTWPGDIDLAPDAMYKKIEEVGCWVIGAEREGCPECVRGEIMQSTWNLTLVDSGDGSGDAMVLLPDELLLSAGWEVGDVLEFDVLGDSTLLIRKVSSASISD